MPRQNKKTRLKRVKNVKSIVFTFHFIIWIFDKVYFGCFLGTRGESKPEKCSADFQNDVFTGKSEAKVEKKQNDKRATMCYDDVCK